MCVSAEDISKSFRNATDRAQLTEDKAQPRITRIPRIYANYSWSFVEFVAGPSLIQGAPLELAQPKKGE